MDSTWVQQELSNVLGIKQEKMAELEALRQETFQKQSLIEDELEQLSLREFVSHTRPNSQRHMDQWLQWRSDRCSVALLLLLRRHRLGRLRG
ncbi:hypothetical protein BU16DRAFT_181174 [Lophium mytilinum]|uniref:Uncharacterized protein n=1 Tax=Lophium mytilinum TaxID=390894 RepID=A0A6A6QCL1_9PEZI|nr:hypothetical protein BU16DRAFT_181174 [Lophium mytilinum]